MHACARMCESMVMLFVTAAPARAGLAHTRAQGKKDKGLQPIVLESGYVCVSGGGLARKWHFKPREVQGVDCISLEASDGQLARVLGVEPGCWRDAAVDVTSALASTRRPMGMHPPLHLALSTLGASSAVSPGLPRGLPGLPMCHPRVCSFDGLQRAAREHVDSIHHDVALGQTCRPHAWFKSRGRAA